MSDPISWPAWIRSWLCTDKNCDGKGTVCLGAREHGDGDIEFDLHQCQFCTEREQLAQYVEQLEKAREDEPKDAAFDAFMAGLGPSRWER